MRMEGFCRESPCQRRHPLSSPAPGHSVLQMGGQNSTHLLYICLEDARLEDILWSLLELYWSEPASRCREVGLTVGSRVNAARNPSEILQVEIACPLILSATTINSLGDFLIVLVLCR